MEKKFYRSKLATIVWDSANNKVLADFQNGFFLTSDNRTIKILKELGYPEVEVESKAPPVGLEVKETIEFKNDEPIVKLESNESQFKLKSEKIKKPAIKKKDQPKPKKIIKPGFEI